MWCQKINLDQLIVRQVSSLLSYGSSLWDLMPGDFQRFLYVWLNQESSSEVPDNGHVPSLVPLTLHTHLSL